MAYGSTNTVLHGQPGNAPLAVLLALCGTALFTPVFAAGKFVDGAVPALAIVAIRYLSGALTVGAVVAITRTPIGRLRSPQPLLHLLRVFLGAGGGVCIIKSATLMPIADATAIGLTEGLLIVAFAALLLGERVTVKHVVAGSLCAAGAFVVVGASIGQTAPGNRYLEGALLAGAGAVLIALETVMIKVLARREGALGVLAHVNGMAALVFLIPGWWFARSAGLGLSDLAPFLCLGPIAILAQYCNIKAFRLADASILGPISYSWILFSALLGYVWFAEVPAQSTFIGATLIVAGGIWLSRLPTQPT